MMGTAFWLLPIFISLIATSYGVDVLKSAVEPE